MRNGGAELVPDAAQRAIEFCYDRGWSDGLPVVPVSQPLLDGCQRNATGLLTFTSPEWVYIYKDPTVRFVQGTVTHTHTAGGDLPEGHDFYDLNSNVNVDPSFTYLVSTANFTGDPTAEDYGRLHVEYLLPEQHIDSRRHGGASIEGKIWRRLPGANSYSASDLSRCAER